MKTIEYSLIVGIPYAVTLLLSIVIVVVLHKKYPQYIVKLVLLAFSGILKTEKKDQDSVYVYDDIELSERNVRNADIEHEVQQLTGYLIKVMFIVVIMIWITSTAIFWQLLLLDQTYGCSENDPTKDCFVFHNIKQGVKDYFNQFTDTPIDCITVSANSTAQIVCYRVVFNIGLATGISYGTFKVMTVVVNIVSMVMLLPKNTSQLNKLKCGIAIVIVSAYAIALGVLYGLDIPLIKLQSQQLAQVLQILFSVVTSIYVVYMWPWSELIAIKRAHRIEMEQPRDPGNGNPGADPAA